MAEEQKRSTFDEFCEVSSCMGIVDLYHAKNILGKIFWFAILVVSLSITVWQTQGVFHQFLNDHPYKISVSKEMMEYGIQYPNITICNFNRIKQSFVDEFNIDRKVLTYAFQFLPTSYSFPLHAEPNLNLSEYEEAWENFMSSSGIRHPLELFQRYGHTLEETIVRTPYTVVMKHEEFLTTSGLCWKIIPNRTEPFAGAQNSIKFLINPKINEYLPDAVINNYVEEGMIIIPSYVNEPMLPSPLYLSPGSYASIALMASKNRELRPEIALRPAVCQSNTTFLILNETYTIANCIFDCYLTTMWKKCGCVMLANTKPNYKLCNLTMATYCVQELMYSNFVTYHSDKYEQLHPSKLKEIRKYEKECISHCRLPCHDTMTVTASLTTANGMSRKVKNSVLNYLEKLSMSEVQLDKDYIDNLISIGIYFVSSEINVLETTETTPIFTLIGEVGGQLGLWVGISLVTVIQGLYYFVLAICRGEFFPRRKNNLLKTNDTSNMSHSFQM